MSFMSPKQIKRFQWIKNLLRNPDSQVKPEEIPILTKELESFEAQLHDEELVTVRNDNNEVL